MDWEHPQLPLVVSLAQDGTVIAWNAKEVSRKHILAVVSAQTTPLLLVREGVV